VVKLEQTHLKSHSSTAFIVVWILPSASGVALFLAPRGKGSGEAIVPGLTEEFWTKLHMLSSFAFLLIGIVHFFLN